MGKNMKLKTSTSLLLLISIVLSGCNYESESSSVSLNEASTEDQSTVATQTIADGDSFKTTMRASSGELIEVTVTNENGHAVFEGDIFVGYTKDLVRQQRDLKSSLEKGLRIRKTPANMGRFWTNAVVPYQFAPGYAESNKQNFFDAVAHIIERTPVTFVERTVANRSQYPNYIEIVQSNDPGACYSYLGMIGGKQEMGLGSDCRMGTTVHEIGHALGLWHEHTRSDRDNFVTINWDNIHNNRKSQFQLNRLAETFGPYDYASIMHYPTWGFAINRWQNTITPLQTGVEIGQRNGLSDGDIAVIADTYGDMVVAQTLELENNVPVYGLSGTRGDEIRMVLNIADSNIKDLKFQLSGGSGDADLYVKRAIAPSLSDYDCRPYIGGNHETCSLDNVVGGEYHVMIRAYSSFAGAQLVASYVVEEVQPVITLQNGISSRAQYQSSGGSGLFYKIEVPAGTAKLNALAIGPGYNGNIQLRYAAKPQGNSYDCSQTGINPACSIDFPQQGTWFAQITAHADTSHASIRISHIKQDQSVLSDGAVRSNLAINARGSVLRYTIHVPAGSTGLKLATTGSNGDADLYVKYASQPGTSNYDCRSYSGSSNEQCNISNPSGGIYHVMVRAYQPFSGLTLKSFLD